MLSKAPILLAILGSLLLAGCEGKANETKTTAGNGKGTETPVPGPDSDLEAEDAVPMALFDGSLVAQLLERSASPIADGFATLPAQPTEAAFVTAATAATTVDYTFSAATIALPDRAEAQLAANAREVRELLDRLFGATGTFRGAELKIRRKGGKTRATYAIPGATTSYVVIEYDATAAFPYHAEIYEAGVAPAGAAPDARHLSTIVDAGGTTAGTRRAKIRHYTRPADASLAAFVLLELDEAARTFTTTMRYETAADARPASSVLRVTDQPATKERLVQGALLWEIAASIAADDSIDPPRHYARKNGDIEMFHGLRGETRVGPSSQAALFLRGEDRAAGNAIARDYVRIMLDHLTAVVRHEGVNQGCGATGDALRDAFAAANLAVPSAVQSLPGDLCRARTEVADEAVAAAIKASCDAKIDLALDVTFATVGKKRYHLCVKHQEAAILANPIATTIAADGSRKIAVDLGPFAGLTERLAGVAWLDLGGLANVAGQRFEIKGLAAADRDAAVSPP